jgi:hypothetical protein
MAKKTAVVLCLVLLVFLGVGAIASIKDGFITINGGRQIVFLNMPTAPTAPITEIDTGLQTISGNLNTDNRYGEYFCCLGDAIGGPNSQRFIWVAVPFTPTANMSVKKVQAAIQHVIGTNEIVLSINSDSSGLPGSAIATFHVKHLEKGGYCCKLTVGTSTAGIPVTQGTQYWLVVSTDSSSQDFLGGWVFNTTDMRPYPLAINRLGNGWKADKGLLPAYAVLGN